ncbi:hypothetical protein AC578_7478 [Pseudocercospora eumusae]|uniref:BTB domain-containing protein n=1 Tax=Pseudocercospora eumusae TaxID=321146 RepID=A0A139H1I2_9PEZI|nr:hypothetical protein AC578_7478 [Pseudocercospora eumusae]
MCTNTTHRRPSKASPPPLETVTSLISRFQSPHTDLVSISLQSLPKPCSLLSKTLLCHLSPYFKRHITPSSSNTLTLPTSDPLIYGILLFWLVHDRLPQSHELDDDDDESPPSEDSDNGLQKTLLVEIWAFAGRIEVSGLQNLCMRGIFEGDFDDDDDEQGEGFEKCLRISEEGSVMRRALVMYMLWFDDAESRRVKEDLGGLERQFLLRDSIDFEKIEGLEGDLKECEGVWKVWDGEGCGRPRAELFFVPVVGGEFVYDGLSGFERRLREKGSVETLRAGESQYLFD